MEDSGPKEREKSDSASPQRHAGPRREQDAAAKQGHQSIVLADPQAAVGTHPGAHRSDLRQMAQPQIPANGWRNRWLGRWPTPPHPGGNGASRHALRPRLHSPVSGRSPAAILPMNSYHIAAERAAPGFWKLEIRLSPIASMA